MPDAAGNSLVLSSAYISCDLLGDPARCLYTGDTSPDFGTPNPDIAVIVGTLLSGDQVTGSRSGNRSINLPVLCTTADDDPSKGTTLAALINPLLQTVDAQPPNTSFTLTWTPAGGLPVVLDCYRGSWSRTRDPVLQAAGVAVYTLAFAAAPFGRSDTPQTIVVGAQVQVDSMSTTPSNATADTVVFFEGGKSAKFTLTGSQSTVVVLGKTNVLGKYELTTGPAKTISPVDVSAQTSLGFRFRWPAPATSGRNWPMKATLTLGDGTHTASQTVTVQVVPGSTAWQLVSFPLTGWGSVNLAAVTSYATSWSAVLVSQAASGTSSAWIDDLRAYPAASSSITTSEGAVFKVPGVLGTAPAPVALALSHPGGMSALALHRPPVGQSQDAQILMALSGSPLGATVAAANNTFAGTYSVVLLIATSSPGAGSRTVTVTATHKQGTTVLATFTVPPVTYTTPTGKFLVVGEITLPLVPVPAENVSDTLVFQVTSTGTGTADTFTDLALFDTTGQLVLIGTLPAGTTVVYVDEPDPTTELGQVYASATDRTAATGLLGWGATTRVDGGPIVWEPGDNRLLAMTPDGVPTLTGSYYPRHLDDRAA